MRTVSTRALRLSSVLQQAAADLSTAGASGALRIPVARVLDLADIAAAHDLVDSGRAGGRVLLAIP